MENNSTQNNLQSSSYLTPGLKVNNSQKLNLRKTIYSIVQTSREFYKKLIEVSKVIGFIESKSNPYFWAKCDYVDNLLVIGKQKSILKLIEDSGTQKKW
jgi:hypothetical protein